MKLISFTICPFVQRAVIMLNEQKRKFEVEYIDLKNKPDWFLEISPRGKVPVLVVDETPLFESHAICEYLDETSDDNKLMSDDPIQRARERAWFALASEDIIMPYYVFSTTKDHSVMTEKADLLLNKLALLDKELEGKKFLSGKGDKFGLADIAFAPFFYKNERLRELKQVTLISKFSNVCNWSDAILAKDSVINSVPESYNDDEVAYYEEAESFIWNNPQRIS